jgi:hypothetical protein
MYTFNVDFNTILLSTSRSIKLSLLFWFPECDYAFRISAVGATWTAISSFFIWSLWIIPAEKYKSWSPSVGNILHHSVASSLDQNILFSTLFSNPRLKYSYIDGPNHRVYANGGHYSQTLPFWSCRYTAADTGSRSVFLPYPLRKDWSSPQIRGAISYRHVSSSPSHVHHTWRVMWQSAEYSVGSLVQAQVAVSDCIKNLLQNCHSWLILFVSSNLVKNTNPFP